MNLEQLYHELQLDPLWWKVSPQDKAALLARVWGIEGASGGADPPAAAAAVGYDIQVVSTISKDLAIFGPTDILNVTEVGILLEIGFHVIGTVQPTPTATIEITIDGGITRSIELYSASVSWTSSFRALAKRDILSDGNAGGDVATLILGTPYLTSLQVAINVTTAAASVSLIESAVLRGIQL